MYAIRSYYEAEVHSFQLPAEVLFLSLILLMFYRGQNYHILLHLTLHFRQGEVQIPRVQVFQNRITSYNVCYTKLLRLHRLILCSGIMLCGLGLVYGAAIIL